MIDSPLLLPMSLTHRYGCADAERRVRELRCIWVSHMHADHHGGLYRLLELRARLLGARATPLLVIGPPPLFRVLRLYQEVVSGGGVGAWGGATLDTAGGGGRWPRGKSGGLGGRGERCVPSSRTWG